MISCRGVAAALPLVVTFALCGWSGCARRGPSLPPVAEGAAGGRQAAEAIAARPCPESLAADLEVRVDPPEGSAVQLFGSLRAAWPDRIRLQLRLGPFMPVLSMAIDGDSATVSLPRDGTYWSGPSRGGIHAPLLWAQGILDAICPGRLARQLEEPILSRLPGERWVVVGRRVEEPQGWVELRSEGGGSLGEVATIALRSPDQQITMLAHRVGRKRIDNSEIPARFSLEIGQPITRLDVRLSRSRTDSGAGADVFRLAPSKEARRLDDEEFRDFLLRLGGRDTGRFSLPDSAILG